MPARDAVETYQADTEDILTTASRLSTHDTTHKLAIPFLTLLGWEPDTPAVTRDDHATPTTSVAFALHHDDTPRVLVDVTAADTQLTTTNRDSLTEAMTDTGVTLGILTNGRAFDFHAHTPATGDTYVVSVPLERLDEYRPLLTAFSHAAFTRGLPDAERAELISRARTTRALRTNEDELKTDIVSLLSAHATPGVAETLDARTDQLFEWLTTDLSLAGERLELGEEAPATTTEEPPEESATVSPDELATSTDPDGAYQVQLHRDGECIETIGGNRQTDAMVATVEYLLVSHGLAEKVDIPYVPGTGRRAFINTTPTHTDGAQMRQSRAAGGYHVFTKLNAEEKQRYLRQVCTDIGLSCTYTGEW